MSQRRQSIGQSFIDLLREDGWLVKVEQLRLSDEQADYIRRRAISFPSNPETPAFIDRYAQPKHKMRAQGLSVSSHGGVTRVTVRGANAPGDDRSYAGDSYCSPSDGFNKRLGLIKATGRLRSEMEKAGVLHARHAKVREA